MQTKMCPMFMIGSFVMLIGLMGGCTVSRLYSTSGNKISLSPLSQKAGDQVTMIKKIRFDYTKAYDLQEVLRENHGLGVSLQNTTFKLKIERDDFFLNLLTLSLANAHTIEIRGDLLKE